MKTFFRFIFSKLFLKQLLIAIIIAIAIYLATLIGLRAFTRHGETIQVPDIKGYNISQVERVITNKELRYIIIDSVYTKEVLPGTVFDQIPAAGAFVKKDRKLFLIMNAKNSELVTMPSLKNVSLRQAKSTLEESGLSLDRVMYVTSEYKNLVLSQMVADTIIPPGTSLPKWTAITLKVGRGLGNVTVDVPYLRGMYWIDARNEIQHFNLNEGAVIEDPSITEKVVKDSAIVWKQYPQPKVLTQVGKTVDLWLTMDTTVVYAADSTLRLK